MPTASPTCGAAEASLTGTEFQRHVQLAVAGMGHSREPWRKRDRAPADTSALADMSRGWSFDALEDIALTADRGRFEWTVGGETTYVKQLMPPSIADMDYDADSLHRGDGLRRGGHSDAPPDGLPGHRQ